MDFLDVPLFSQTLEYLWCIDQLALGRMLAWRYADYKRPDEPVALTRKTPASGGKSIAVIEVAGVLMKSAMWFGTSTIQLRKEIQAAVADSDVSGILLNVDSPGGTVAGTYELAAEVNAAKKSKPVWASIADLGASAAYWVASQADKIVASSPTALIGSIGTIQVIYDQSAAAEKEGVKAHVFATGPLKGLGTPGAKITEDQSAHIQSLVDDVQKNFDAAVMEGRGLSEKQLAAVRHGGVMTAPQAMSAGLIDAIQPLSKTVSQFTRSISSGPRADSGGSGVMIPTIRRLPPTLN